VICWLASDLQSFADLCKFRLVRVLCMFWACISYSMGVAFVSEIYSRPTRRVMSFTTRDEIYSRLTQLRDELLALWSVKK